MEKIYRQKQVKRRLFTVLLLVLGIFWPSSARPVVAQTPLPNRSSLMSASVLVVDVSTSMDEPWQGGVKIESARSAAHQVINMLEQDSSLGAPHRAGVVSFSNNAQIDIQLTSTFAQVHAVIDQLGTRGSTNIYSGLEAANQILSQATVNESKIVILLSDGMTNVGPSRDEILAGPVQQAAGAGTCIYTIGFGDPGALDEDLLRRIASESGCGEYYYAADLGQLSNIYVRIRHQSTGDVLANWVGEVAQGQTVTAGTIKVSSGQEQLAVSLTWPGSKVVLRIHSPNGDVLTPATPGVSIVEYTTMVYAIVLQPIPGDWWFEVFGAEIPQGIEPYQLTVSARSSALPASAPAVQQNVGPGVPVALMIVLVGGGGMALYIYANTIKRKRLVGVHPGSKRQTGLAASLRFVGGPLSGSKVPIGQMPLTIGRGAANLLQIPDTSVSRLHAIIRYAQGRWFLQDQSSSAGTFVNNQYVRAVGLKDGDQIRIGSSVIVFHIE